MAQEEIKVRIKRLHPNAVIPEYAKPGDAGMDLVATSWNYDKDLDNHVYGTGIAVEIPEGYVGLIFPRSSNRKTESYMTNHVGVIDSGYRGEIMVTFKNRDNNQVLNCVHAQGYVTDGLHRPYKEGDRIAQIMIIPYPFVEFEEVEELSETERGANGHGSTGA